MADELERKDVEELLRSMDAEQQRQSTEQAGGERDDGAGSAAHANRQRIVAYDFKRPERVGKEQIRALQSVHEGFARNLGASLSALLRTVVTSKLVSVDQLTYSELVYSLEVPTCFVVLRPQPLEGNWILDISPLVLYPIIDRLLGGTPGNESVVKRPLSEIELRLARRIINILSNELSQAWKNAIELTISQERIEANPQLVQIVPPNEVVVLTSFELTMGKARGMVNLCIPYNTIERIGSRLTANNWAGYSSSRPSEQTRKQIESLLGGSVVELVGTLAHSSITTIDLLNLQVGDIITTEKDIHDPIELQVAGLGKFHGRVGIFKGKKAVEVLGPIIKDDAHSQSPQPTGQQSTVGENQNATPPQVAAQAAAEASEKQQQATTAIPQNATTR